MIFAYFKDHAKRQLVDDSQLHLLKEAIWIDLVSPTRDEEKIVEEAAGLNVPTREEMLEIELSSRLYKDGDNLVMTAIMIANSESLSPVQEPVTFVLAPTRLVTIRYIEPQAFKLFINQLEKFQFEKTALNLLIGLLEATIDRLADILEIIGHRLDKFSKTIFCQHVSEENEKLDYYLIMQNIGLNADLNTKVRESLVTFNRLNSFLTQSESIIKNGDSLRLATVNRDISALSDHANFISSKVNFLLDGTLGMINIEQNNIIKIFSVAAVIFLPPTLIASIYGMNFKFIPELSYKWGYYLALLLMFVSALLPYRYFKYKKWL